MLMNIPYPKDADEAVKFDHTTTVKFLAARIAEGFGRGNGQDYKSWITFRQFSSRGTTTRMHSVKLKRTVILFSNVERDLFLDSEFDAGFVDYRENFRLDVDLTDGIAQKLKTRHPRYPHSPVKSVMTLDAVLSRVIGKVVVDEAVDCKYAYDLEKIRVNQKLKIHETAANHMGMHHRLNTEATVGRVRSQTIQWIRIAVKDGVIKDDAEKSLFEDIIKDSKRLAQYTTLAEYCQWRDEVCGLNAGTSMNRFRGLVWQHELNMPFDQMYPAHTPLHRITVGDPTKARLYIELNS